MVEWLQEYGLRVYGVVAEAAPFFLFGLFVSAVFHSKIPQSILLNLTRGNGFFVTLKASLIGTPIPLCSCGVVPVAIDLHRRGVPSHAVASFLVATPENGIDSVSISWSLLGLPVTVVRFVAGVFVAQMTGLAVLVFGDKRNRSSQGDSDKKPEDENTSCCASNSSSSKSSSDTSDLPTPTLIEAVKFMMNDFLESIVIWMALGFLLSGAIGMFLDPSIFEGLGHSQLLIAAIVGLPLYVCASASTPIALSLMGGGMSLGAVLVFLLTGPATNASNVPLYIKEFGVRFCVVFYGALLVFSLFVGWAVDESSLSNWLFVGDVSHVHGQSWYQHLFAFILIVLMVRSYWNVLSHSHKNSDACH